MSPQPMCAACRYFRAGAADEPRWGRCQDLTKAIYRADGSPQLAPLVFANHWCHGFVAALVEPGYVDAVDRARGLEELEAAAVRAGLLARADGALPPCSPALFRGSPALARGLDMADGPDRTSISTACPSCGLRSSWAHTCAPVAKPVPTAPELRQTDAQKRPANVADFGTYARRRADKP